MNREAASWNIKAAIRARKEKFSIVGLTWSTDGYTVVFAQGRLSVTKQRIDEGTMEDTPAAGQLTTLAMAALLDDVRRRFGAREPRGLWRDA